jgi:hypothetical protein
LKGCSAVLENIDYKLGNFDGVERFSDKGNIQKKIADIASVF